MDQGLEAAAEAEEHVGHAPAQGRLLGRDPHRGRVHGIEGPGHLADLVAVADADGLGLGHEVDRLGPLEPLDHAGQLAVGDLLGRGPQQAEGTQQGPDDDQGQADGQGQDEQDGGGVQAGRVRAAVSSARLASTAAAPSCSSTRRRSSISAELTVHHSAGSSSSRGAVSLAMAWAWSSLARWTSGPTRVSTKAARWASSARPGTPTAAPPGSRWSR